MGSRLGLGLFAALAGVLTATGTFLTRLLLGGEQVTQSVLADIERENQQARQAALDQLDARLVNADDDPRPELALRDLRALLKAFEDLAREASSVHLAAILEVRGKVEQLFEQSVRSLEQTLRLGETAQRLQTPAARQPILRQRENILEDVRAGIKQLGGTLAALQRLESGGGAPGAELTRLRDELDQSLLVANRVEARLHSLLDQTAAEVQQQPLTSQPEKG
jgi:hypothetical protein